MLGSRFYTGHKAISNVTPTQVVASMADNPIQGARIRAHPANTDTIWVGPTGVTAANGYPLAAGQELPIGVTDAGIIYALAAVNNEVLCWIVE